MTPVDRPGRLRTMHIGARIEEARTARGIPLVHVARAAGISYEGLHNIIMGRSSPRLTTLQRIAAALGVEVADLVGSEDK